MIFEEFKIVFSDCILDGEKIRVQKNLRSTIEFIEKHYHYNILKDIKAVDLGNGEIELIYHLFQEQDEEDLLLSIIVKNEAESICDIFKSALADEKEIYDMFGIKFIGHKNLERLYMPESWEGFPLRKDYIESDERLAWNDHNNA